MWALPHQNDLCSSGKDQTQITTSFMFKINVKTLLEVSVCPHQRSNGSVLILKIHGQTSLTVSYNKKLLIALQKTWKCIPHEQMENNMAKGVMTVQYLFLFQDILVSTRANFSHLSFSCHFHILLLGLCRRQWEPKRKSDIPHSLNGRILLWYAFRQGFYG